MLPGEGKDMRFTGVPFVGFDMTSGLSFVKVPSRFNGVVDVLSDASLSSVFFGVGSRICDSSRLLSINNGVVFTMFSVLESSLVMLMREFSLDLSRVTLDVLSELIREDFEVSSLSSVFS